MIKQQKAPVVSSGPLRFQPPTVPTSEVLRAAERCERSLRQNDFLAYGRMGVTSERIIFHELFCRLVVFGFGLTLWLSALAQQPVSAARPAGAGAPAQPAAGRPRRGY
jgi:hypothetical protein